MTFIEWEKWFGEPATNTSAVSTPGVCVCVCVCVCIYVCIYICNTIFHSMYVDSSMDTDTTNG